MEQFEYTNLARFLNPLLNMIHMLTEMLLIVSASKMIFECFKIIIYNCELINPCMFRTNIVYF